MHRNFYRPFSVLSFIASLLTCPVLLAQVGDGTGNPNRIESKNPSESPSSPTSLPAGGTGGPGPRIGSKSDNRKLDRSKAETESFLIQSQSTENPLHPPSQFLRLSETDGMLRSLDTAVVSYRSSSTDRVSVDLIGAIHIAEATYYAALNERFDSYDVLLYELVAQEGTQIPLGGKRDSAGFNPVSMLQDGAKNILGLESQLEKIDYTKKHFVRADMTPSQLAEKMSQRGETPLSIALDTLANMLRQQNLANDQSHSKEWSALDPGMSLTDLLAHPLKMKRLLAQQFVGMGSLDQAMGTSLNQLLVVDRNAQALDELRRQMAAGKKKIGIFYGAAHLPDLERRLIDDFGLAKQGQEWLPAWDLTTAKKAQLSQPANLLLNVLRLLE